MRVFCLLVPKLLTLSRAVTSGAFLLLLACNTEEQQFPTYSPAEGNPALLTSDDIAVYEAVISGYADAGQILMLRPAPGPPPDNSTSDHKIEARTTQNVVRMRPSTSKGSDVVPEPDRWWTLDRKPLRGLIVPQSAVNDFKVRTARRASLKAFRAEAPAH
jgi:hypothetical protein